MKTRKIISIITAFCYGIFAACGLYIFLSMKKAMENGSSDVVTEELGAAGIIILTLIGVLYIFFFIYAALALLGMLLKVINIFSSAKALPIICMMFDFCFVALHGYLFAQSLSGDFFAFTPQLVLLLISVGAMIMNIITLTIKE